MAIREITNAIISAGVAELLCTVVSRQMTDDIGSGIVFPGVLRKDVSRLSCAGAHVACGYSTTSLEAQASSRWCISSWQLHVVWARGEAGYRSRHCVQQPHSKCLYSLTSFLNRSSDTLLYCAQNLLVVLPRNRHLLMPSTAAFFVPLGRATILYCHTLRQWSSERISVCLEPNRTSLLG